jgi:hypothetical protein
MAARPVFRVTDRTAPRRAADPGIAREAEAIRAETARNTPRRTGRLASGWRVTRGRVTGVYVVENDVPYARFVEYGTRRRPATPALGVALARRRR